MQQDLVLNTNQLSGADQRIQHCFEVFDLREACCNLIWGFRSKSAFLEGFFNQLLIVVGLCFKVIQSNTAVYNLEDLAIHQRVGDFVHNRHVLVFEEFAAEFVAFHTVTQWIFFMVSSQHLDSSIL